MGISPMPQLLSKLFERYVRETTGFGLSDPTFIGVLGEPFAGKFFDDSRCLAAMKIEGSLEVAMIANRMEP